MYILSNYSYLGESISKLIIGPLRCSQIIKIFSHTANIHILNAQEMYGTKNHRNESFPCLETKKNMVFMHNMVKLL